MHRQSFALSGRSMVLIFVTGCVKNRAIERLEGLGQLKNIPKTSLGTD
jgi:hypothetical protein